MTVASLGALVLRDHLRRHGEVAPRRFLRDLAGGRRRLGGLDGRGPGDPGGGGATDRTDPDGGRYIARLHAAAAQDPSLSVAFVRVMALVDPPTALFGPRIVAKVLRPRHRGATSPLPSERAGVA